MDRRTSVELASCLDCHQTLSLHGSNRTDDIQVCVACHNPRNTDREVREIAANPPTDGKDEESLDFKRMVHGIHAAAIRENPLQIVGFRGFTTYVYDEEEVQFPGDISNCLGCHTDDGYTLPLADGVLGTTIDTGSNHESPVDDTVITPVTAVCSSCHDGQTATAHMEDNGGSFSTSQAAIDSGEVVETCALSATAPAGTCRRQRWNTTVGDLRRAPGWRGLLRAQPSNRPSPAGPAPDLLGIGFQASVY